MSSNKDLVYAVFACILVLVVAIWAISPLAPWHGGSGPAPEEAADATGGIVREPSAAPTPDGTNEPGTAAHAGAQVEGPSTGSGSKPEVGTGYVPRDLKPANADGEQKIPSFQLDEGFDVKLFAAEPDVANPVAFWVDADGRVFVAETFRQEDYGVPDNRAHSYWVDDDYAAQTVEDRRRMYLKHHPEYATEWTKEHDRVRLLRDTDGDGRADAVTVFADGFNDILDGTGAGVLSDGPNVYFTCIPHLWLLTDADGDGVAEKRKSLHGAGYGVRVALRGHDMHGLVRGPDGKIYYSIGDRGYNVTTQGKNLADPQSGAVFRCNPDGSELELFATGLRNPQELAFDDYGNLVTGDNNSDSDDKARIVYIPEGGEIGWRMTFQTLPRRGPWVREHWWKPRHEGQAAFLIPPLANVGNGPSGFAFYPGTGLPERYDGKYFMCDFRGGRKSSGVRMFSLEPEGAGFTVGKVEWFIKNILPTDCDFGPDGNVWISDWVESWAGVGRGRLYTIRHREAAETELARETVRLLKEDLDARDLVELAGIMTHRDRRVRQRAQFAFVRSTRPGAAETLVQIAVKGRHELAGIHALWAIGQRARRGERDLLEEILPVLGHGEPERRAQAARVLGDLRHAPALERLLAMTTDEAPRARYFATMALGKIGDTRAFDHVVAMIRANDDADLYLRHAGVMALAWLDDSNAVHALRASDSRAVRLAAVLALRRFHDARLRDFLRDPDENVRVEAARAIYDVPIRAAVPDVAALLGTTHHPAIVRRALGAHDMLSGAENAAALGAGAADATLGIDERLMALRSLFRWDDSPLREPVLNDHRPRPPRRTEHAVTALRGRLAGLIRRPTAEEREAIAKASGEPVQKIARRLEQLRRTAARAAARYGMDDAVTALQRVAGDAGDDVDTRTVALRELHGIDAKAAEPVASQALRDREPKLRARAADVLARIDPVRAVPILERSIREGTVEEKQLGLKTLGRMKTSEADAILERWMDKLILGEAPNAVAVELVGAATSRGKAGSKGLGQRLARWESSIKDPLGRHLQSLEGGDAGRGRRVFLNKSETNCRRCHQVSGLAKSEMAGPDLSDVGKRRDRRHILESIVDPNAHIAEGFESVTLVTYKNKFFTGQIIEETETTVRIEYDDYGQTARKTLQKSDIKQRRAAKSGMPEDLVEKLSPSELRDIVEFLVNEKGGKTGTGGH